MSVLLKQEKGNVFNALAAYNAGPGNLAAGDGYAQHIFSGAGLLKGLKQGATGVLNTTSAGNGATEGGQGVAGAPGSQGNGGWTSWLGTFWNDVSSTLITIPGQFIGAASDADKLVDDLVTSYELFLKPATWIRIGAGIVGTGSLITGIVFLVKEANA
jgi:hypothetical protein